jgi:hypothetical protein
MDDNEKLALDALVASTRYYCAQIDAANAELYDSRLRINHLEDVLAALLADDNEKTRSDAERALCS